LTQTRKKRSESMILVQFSLEVADDKIREFARYSREVLKKSWESHGCRSYTAYRSVERRIRPDQAINRNEVIEELFFDSVNDVVRFFDASILRQADVEAAESYKKRFHVGNMHSRILELLE
jgi:hypothetical protein